MAWVPNIVDYDRAIYNLLTSIKVTGADGTKQPVHVTFFAPEHEGELDVDQKRPAIIIYLEDIAHDTLREISYISEVVDQTQIDITTQTTPTPVKFIYQFTVSTAFQQHMTEIITQMQLLFPMRGYITVANEDGSEENHYDFFQKGFTNGFTNQYLQYGLGRAEREFRKIYRYHLMGEVVEAESMTFKKVQVHLPQIYQRD